MAKKGYFSAKNVAWRELPSGYTQVLYIESSGTQCINTLFKPNQNTRVVVDIQVVSFDGYAPLFGSRVASKNAEFSTWAIAETDIQDGYGTQAESKLVAEALKRNIIDKNKNMLYVGGVLLKTHTVQTFAPNYPIFLFNINTAGSTTGSFKTFAKLYSCQIYDNGTLIRDYVPCKNASGTAGLYDVVNGVFYGNAGTGSFLAGDEVHSDVAREPKKVYFSDNGVARLAKKSYFGDENGIARLWYASSVPISTLAVGSSVFMNVNGVRTEFLVVHQGNPDTSIYNESCNGTWVLMKNCYTTTYFELDDWYYYISSDLAWTMGNFVTKLDSDILKFVKNPQIPYIDSENGILTGSDGAYVRAFALSMAEVDPNYQDGEGAILSYFNSTEATSRRKSDKAWWLRSVDGDGLAYYCNTSGGINGTGVGGTRGARPAMILSLDALVDSDFNVIA